MVTFDAFSDRVVSAKRLSMNVTSPSVVFGLLEIPYALATMCRLDASTLLVGVQMPASAPIRVPAVPLVLVTIHFPGPAQYTAHCEPVMVWPCMSSVAFGPSSTPYEPGSVFKLQSRSATRTPRWPAGTSVSQLEMSRASATGASVRARPNTRRDAA